MAGTSYTRQSTLTDGDTITSALFNAEYNQLVTAFSYASTGTTGHQHDGGAGEGGNIEIIGDQDFLNKIVVDSTNNRWSVFVEVGGSAVEQIRIQDGAIVPVTDSDIDLGTSSLEFKDGYFDGTIHVDTLDVDANATIAGTLGVTGNTTVGGTLGITGNTTVGGTLVVTGTTTLNGGTLTLGDAASDNVVFGADVNSNIIPNTDSAFDLGSSSQEWRDLYLDGTAHIDTLDVDVNATIAGTLGVTGVLTASSLDISGNIDVDGTTNLDVVDIDGAVDMATTLTVAGAVDFNGALDVDGVTNLDVVDIDGAVDMATTLAVAGNVDFNGDLDVDGTTNLDVVDIDGAVDMASTLAVAGVLTAASLDISGNVDVDGTIETDALTINSIGGLSNITNDLAIFSTSSGHNGLRFHADGILPTNNAGVIVDADADLGISSHRFKDLHLSGAVNAASLDISGNIDVDGVTNLDVVDIDGAVDMASTLNVSGAITGTLGTAAQTNITSLGTLASLSVTGDLLVGDKIRHAGDTDNYIAFPAADEFRIVTGNAGRIYAYNSQVVINEDSTDTDFRVESNGNQNMLFVDGGNDRVGIGRVPSISNSKLEVGGADNVPIFNVEASGNTGGMGIGSTGLQLFHGASSKVLIGSGGMVVNEAGADYDFRVESNGNANMLFVDGGADAVIINGNASVSFGGESHELQVNDTNFSVASFATYRNGSDGAALSLGHSRNSTIGSQTVVQNGDKLGQIDFYGSDGTDFAKGASISASVQGTPGNNDMPGVLNFATSADNSDSPTERMQIQSDGKIRLGSSGDHILVDITGSNAALKLVDNNQSNPPTLRGNGPNFTIENGGVERMRIDTGFVFNETGIDQDFRVESNANANALFVNGGTNNVGINSTATNARLEVVATSGEVFRADSNGGAYRIIADQTGVNMNGLVGIGTTNPVEQLAVGGAGRRIEIGGSSGVIRGFNRSASWAGINFEASDYTFDVSTVRILDIASAGVIFNDPGVNTDFRIESDGNANMLFLDAGVNRVCIGTSVSGLNLASALGSSSLTVADGIMFGTSPNTTSYIGTGNTTGDVAIVANATPGNLGSARSVRIKGGTSGGGGPADIATLNATVGSVFNEGGLAAQDFRVESDGNANMLFVDGGNNGVGIGTATAGNSTLEVRSTGVDGTFANAIGFQYSGNASEANTISTAVSSNATQSGFKFNVSDGGGSAGKTSVLKMTRAEMTVNDDSNDYDFRVESDAESNAFTVDGGTGQVGVGSRSGFRFGNGSLQGNAGSSGGGYPTIGYNIKFTGTAGNFGTLVGDTSWRMDIGNNNRLQVHSRSSSSPVNAGATYTAGPFVSLNGTTWTDSSDARLKENVSTITGAIDKVKAMRPVNYTWIHDGEGASNQVGFIAQEMALVVPEVVDISEDDEVHQGIQYGKLVPVLTAALQEALTKIETLETRLTALENA